MITKREYLEPFHPNLNPKGYIATGSPYDTPMYHNLQKEAIAKAKEGLAPLEVVKTVRVNRNGILNPAMQEVAAEAPRYVPPVEMPHSPCQNDPKEMYKDERVPDIAPDTRSVFFSKTANQWIKEASRKPDPKQLWYEFWHEGELGCLFADSNTGKSILAVQIAHEVSANHGLQTLYFDFEMSSKQFQKRYSNDTGKVFQFSDRFRRLEINPNHLNEDSEFEQKLMAEIKNKIITQKAKVVIIDNLGFICTQGESGEAAGRLMRQFKEIQASTKVSMLVLGHTPKRDMTLPLTQNELAGSKRLFNFFDSVFAIGQSARDNDLRYLKQIKVRASEFTYNQDNVLTCEIIKDDCFLKFKAVRKEPEYVHLRKPSDDAVEEMESKVILLHKEGSSIREIAEKLRLSRNKVHRIVKRLSASDASQPQAA